MSAVDQEYRWKTLGPASVLPTFSPAADAAIATSVESPAVESEHDAGYEAGYAAGEAAGKAAVEAAQRDALMALQTAVAELTRVRGEVFARSFTDMADSLQELFKTLFLHELRTDPRLLEKLCGVMQDALESATAPELRLSSADYAHIAPMAEALGITISEDTHLPAGVMRAVVGKGVAELDVAANLNDVLAQAVHAAELDEAEMLAGPAESEPRFPDELPDELPDDPGSDEPEAT